MRPDIDSALYVRDPVRGFVSVGFTRTASLTQDTYWRGDEITLKIDVAVTDRIAAQTLLNGRADHDLEAARIAPRPKTKLLTQPGQISGQLHLDEKYWLVHNGHVKLGGGPDGQKFKMVWPGEVVYGTLEQAKHVAGILSAKNPGAPFYVMEAVHVVSTETVEQPPIVTEAQHMTRETL